MTDINRVLSRELAGILVLLAAAFVGLFLVLPDGVVPILAAFTAMAFVYFGIAALLARYQTKTPDWLSAAPAWLIFLLPVIIGFGFLFRFWADATYLAVVFVVALMFIFVYYWLLVPLALVQKLEQLGWEDDYADEITDWPDITILVPAFKERGYIGRLLDSVAAATYPAAVEIIVIDDGSLDGTYEEATAHAGTNATIIQKENGGKHSALNRGLEEATHDIIVSIDADSWIAPDALTKLVREFERNPDAGAIAGNVKVGNRNSFITKLQALEYIVGINTFRRAFDHIGLVTVVPGCLGAFRKETLETVEGYSADTLTEDFDLTIEILKRGEHVHASEGIVYTEAPHTWRRLYRQRLRWYRGNIQTLRKHARVFTDGRYGLLHRLAFPYAFLSMTLLPLFGILALAVIPAAILAGELYLLVVTAVFFLLLIVLLSLLAVEIDQETRSLAAYSPFSIIGYKQFLDVVLLRSIFDVFSGRTLRWTSPGRITRDTGGKLMYDPPSASAAAPVVASAASGSDMEDKAAATSFEVYQDAADEWRWRLRHQNGNILADSGEGYDTRTGVRDAVGRIRQLAGDADTLEYDPAGFEVYKDASGEWRWQLRSKAGRLVARTKRGFDSRGDTLEAIDRIRDHASKAGHWSVTVGERGGYHWRLTAPNGVVLARNTKQYGSKSDAEAGIERVRNVLPTADTLEYDPAGFEVYTDSIGEWRWRLQHRNGRILADGGEGYSSRQSAERGIESVRRTAEETVITELRTPED